MAVLLAKETAMKPSPAQVAIVAALLLLMAIPIGLVAFLGDAGWSSRFGFVLQVLAVYGIGIGFVQKSEALKAFAGIDEMTSPNLLKFVRGNAIFLGIVNSLVAVALGARATRESIALGATGRLLVLCAFPVIYLCQAVHIVLIMPFAYLGYLFTSALVESIAGSSEDAQWDATEHGELRARLDVRAVIAENSSAMKSFLIGVPATVLSFVLKGIEIFS
jgi:hypothetical protein